MLARARVCVSVRVYVSEREYFLFFEFVCKRFMISANFVNSYVFVEVLPTTPSPDMEVDRY